MAVTTNPLKFGSLLIELELISANDLSDALQVAPQFGLPIGRTLVLSGFLTEEELQLAVELQPLINSKSCTIEDAKKVASLVRKNKVPTEVAMEKIGIKGTQDRATLGTLLLEAGFINHAQLEQAKRTSYETGLRLGRVLVLNGNITHALLTRALHLQSMIREKRISQQQAVELLMAQASSEKTRSLEMEANALTPAPAPKVVRFGEFLVLSGLATENEILTAMETSLNRQLSLEQSIIELGLVSKKIYDKALELYHKVANGEYALRQATGEIHDIVFGKLNRNQTVSPVLGELLKMTGFVTDADISEAVELSNKYPSLIGKMLVISGAIDEATLIASLRCQFLLKYGVISIEQAVAGLQFSREHKISFDDSLIELGISKHANMGE